MSRELIQSGFFDMEPAQNDEITIVTGWASLSDTDFKQAAMEHHRSLDQQEAVIDALKNRIILEKGELYIAAKKRLEHGAFLDWLAEINVSHATAKHYMQIVRELGDELANGLRVSHLAFRQWIGIVHSPEKKQIVAKIEAGEIEATPAGVNSALEAAKKRMAESDKARLEAQEAARLAQQELFNEKKQNQARIEEYNQQIEEYEEKIATLTTPQEKIIHKDTPETKTELLRLQSKVSELTTQRDNLALENKELSADLDVVETKHEEDARILRVRQEWQRSADAMHKSIVRFMGQLPMPLDAQLFESDDWAMLNQVEETFQRGIEACRNVHRSTPYMVIDAG